MTKRAELEQLQASIKNKFGAVNGIIHSAGVVRDAFIVKKTPEDIQAVLAPKIQGTINLDQVWQKEPLDFFLLFSSAAATLGNVGQIDYAYANGFMDSYALYRDAQKAKGKRFGQSIAIDWPLWAEGGMHIDEAAKQWMQQVLGAEPLSTQDGIAAFLSALVQKNNQAIILTGRRTKLAKLLGQMPPKTVSTTTKAAPHDELLLEKVQRQLLKTVAELLKIKVEHLDAEESLSEYGVDSISLTSFANQMNTYYQLELTPAILFEHQTIKSFAEYLVNEHREAMTSRHPIEGKPTEKLVPAAEQVLLQSAPHQRYLTVPVKAEQKEEDIAIIGMSGLFPGAHDLDDFWSKLATQKDLISEIPNDRWDWHKYYGEGENKTKVKWGGFINDIDKFDAAFFAISPREAELMDPQQRIFLETVWKAIEDAGYTPGELAKIKTGLFVGVSSNDYSELLQYGGNLSAYAPTGNAHSVLANRVSYLFNLRGPSVPIDTACSSSLVALHQAIKCHPGR